MNRRTVVLLAVFGCAICFAAAIAFVATPASAQDLGYSYLRINVNGKTAQNFASNPAYSGWMSILDVRARRRLASRAASSPRLSQKLAIAYGPWTNFSAIMRDSKIGPGRLEFDAGDDGQLGPLLNAQRNSTSIPDAVLDFYTEEQNRFVGEFDIEGIRILALRDVPASACPMYEITFSFQSIVKK
ncbi:MAG TPA: hypothetical protein VIY69_09945 [Candidatus Acidoferrales bacterium]